MAGEQKYTVDIGVTGLSGLNKLQTNLDGLNKKMIGLRSIIAGGLFAGLARGALAMADDLQDLANSTGIATARLLEFKKALVENGGAADQMSQGITTFVRSIDEAAQGSLKAQNTFRELEVSLNDLQTMGEQELMVKALKGIGNITDASRRAAILMDLFGKSFRTVDAGALAAQLEKTAGSADKYAAALKRGAELNDALATAGGNVKLAFLEAFSPIIQSLNEFNAKTAEGESRMTGLITVIKIAGAALVASFSVGILLGVVTAIGQIGRGLAVIVGLGGTAGAGVAAGMASAFTASGKLLVALRAIAVLFSAGLGIYTATQLFDDFGSTAVNALARITELIGSLLGTLSGGAFGAAVGSAFGPIGTILGGLAGAFAGDKLADALGMKSLVDKAAEARVSAEKLAQEQKKVATETKKASDATKEQAAAVKRAVDTTAFTTAVRGIQKVGDAYKENGLRIAQNIELETQALNNSKQANDLEAARVALSNRSYDAVQQLREAQASMSKELRDAGLGKYYEDQIALINKMSVAEDARLESLITNLHLAKAAEDERLFTTKESSQAFEDVLRLEKELSMIGYGEQAKSIKELTAAADERARAQIRALEASRNEKLGEEEKAKIFAISRASTQELTDATNRLADAKEKFAQKESLRLFDLKTEYDLQDKLKGLQDEVAKMTMPALEQKYYDIAAAARDSADAAIRAEEDRRSAIAGTRVLLDKSEVKAYYEAAAAGSAKLAKQTKELYDKSRSFSTGWKKAFNDYKDAATNAAAAAARVFDKFTSGLEDAIVNFAKTGKFEFKSFVADMAEELLRSQIKQTISGLGDILGMGSLFGGGGDSAPGASPSNPSYSYIVNGGDVGGIVGSLTGGGGLSSIFGGGSKAPSTASGGGIGGGIFTGISDAIGSIGSGISSVFGGITDTVGSIFSGGGIGGGGGIMDAVGSIFGGGDMFGGIADLFSGFFADGGNIPRGRFGIAGEKGPEMIGGPASVTPMGGSTNVTYNITATDAASFQALVARDPSFIHAVAQQGARTIPARR